MTLKALHIQVTNGCALTFKKVDKEQSFFLCSIIYLSNERIQFLDSG